MAVWLCDLYLILFLEKSFSSFTEGFDNLILVEVIARRHKLCTVSQARSVERISRVELVY